VAPSRGPNSTGGRDPSLGSFPDGLAIDQLMQ
jgi:hypothetical protein